MQLWGFGPIALFPCRVFRVQVSHPTLLPPEREIELEPTKLGLSPRAVFITIYVLT
jgi:hypothetical protein